MKARLKRALIALVVVLVGYQLYSVAANVFIAPSIIFADATNAPSLRSKSARSFEGLFPVGSWELGRPKVLETDQGTLLFDEYHAYSDGRIKLDRCTLICDVHSFDSTAPRNHGTATSDPRPLVLRAESGAIVQFDEPLNLMSGRFGRVVGGRLAGEIKIFSPPSTPGAEDALEITTQGIQIDRQRIWTPHEVSFRYGRNRGSGRVLSIELPQKRDEGNSTEDSPTAGRIKSLELVHLDHLEIHSVNDLFSSPADRSDRSADLGDESTDLTVEIRCRGPVRFDFQRNIASFSEQVDVIRHNLVGPSDQLNCEELEIHFQATSVERTPRKGSRPSVNDQIPTSSAMQTKKIVARGFPVIVRAPSRGATLRAEKMEYEFGRRRLWLKDRRQLTFQTPRFHVVAPELEYELPLEGQLGRLWASGPGSLTKASPEKADRLTVDWTRELRMVPQEDSHVLSVQGATVAAADATMSGDEVHVYLREQTGSAQPDATHSGATAIVVERMRAAGRVHVDSARLSGSVSEAKVWFVQAATQQGGQVSPAAGSTLLPVTAAGATDPATKFELAGDVLHAQIAVGKTPQLMRLSVNGRVRLTERSTANSHPTLFSGDRLEFRDSNAGQLGGELTGHPAKASVQGMSLQAPRISFSQRDNQLQLFGPGEMLLPSSSRAVPTTEELPPIRIHWTGGMSFDGLRARFEKNINVEGTYISEKGETHRLSVSSELLDVTMTRRVDFKESKEQHQVEVREFRFPSWAFLENQQFDRLGAKQSHDEMQVRDLVVNNVSGRIHGVGPGWIVHRGRDSGADGRTPLSRSVNRTGLAFLRIDFERELTGNHHLRDITFSDRVVSVYGPIASWHQTLDIKAAQDLREHDVLLTCQRLTVASMASAGGSLDTIEFQATGNASVVGRTFSGLGERISYSRKKDQLILTGDGRSDAHLKYQRPGGRVAELNAARVEFYPRTKGYKVQEIQSFEAHAPSQFRDVRRSTRPQSGILRRGYSPRN